MFFQRQIFPTAVALALSIALLVPALADVGTDTAGWKVKTDPRKRAFLQYVAEDFGARVLVLGCLRDVDMFEVISEQDSAVSPDVSMTLRLVNGTAEYTVQGKFGATGFGVGVPGFGSELFDVNARKRNDLRQKLLPVLEGKGPIVLTIGSYSRTLPVSGLADVLGRFKAICFDAAS